MSMAALRSQMRPIQPGDRACILDAAGVSHFQVMTASAVKKKPHGNIRSVTSHLRVATGRGGQS